MIEKMNIQNNDVIVFRSEEYDSSNTKYYEEIINRFKKLGINLTVLVLPKSVKLEKLSENHMNSLGWYRKGECKCNNT